jgi:hypothetical protein
MQTWNQLLSAALLGTERGAPVSLADLPDALAINDPDPARQLLLLAASTSIYLRAGIVPQRSQTPPVVPPPPETLPPCRPQTMLIMKGAFGAHLRTRQLILEGLTHLALKQKRIPHPFLPRLFELVAIYQRDARWVHACASVMGARGSWLAAQQPKWAFLLRAEPHIPSPPVRLNEAQTDYILSVIKKTSTLTAPDVIAEIGRFEGVWSSALMTQFITRLTQHVKRFGQARIGGLTELVFLFPPEGLPAAMSALMQIDASQHAALQDFIEMLALRDYLLRELAHE